MMKLCKFSKKKKNFILQFIHACTCITSHKELSWWWIIFKVDDSFLELLLLILPRAFPLLIARKYIVSSSHHMRIWWNIVLDLKKWLQVNSAYSRIFNRGLKPVTIGLRVYQPLFYKCSYRPGPMATFLKTQLQETAIATSKKHRYNRFFFFF